MDSTSSGSAIGGSDAPMPPSHRPFQDTKAFIIIPLVLIVVIIGIGAFLITNKGHSAALTSSSTLPTTSLNGQSSTITQSSTVNPTTSISNNQANVTCPCMTKTQIIALFNDSYTAQSSAIYSTRSSTNFSNDSSLPQPLFNSLVKKWYVKYNGPGNQGHNSSFSETIIKSTDAAGLYNYELNYSLSHSNATHSQGTTYTGFNYTYWGLTVKNDSGAEANYAIVIGYKDGYFVSADAATVNNGSRLYYTQDALDLSLP